MKTAFSTRTVHARDRLAYWREEATKAYVAHDFSTRVGRGFHGEIRVASLGSVDLAAFECDECLVERTQQRLAGANDDDVLLCRQVVGHTSVHQDGRDAVTAPGDVYLLDPRRPFALDVGPSCRSVVYKVPRWEVQARLGDIVSYTATMLPQAAPVTALASEFLGMIAVRADAIDPAMGPRLRSRRSTLSRSRLRGGSAPPFSSPRRAPRRCCD